MDWEIRHTKKFKYHTYLKEVLKPILDNIQSYNWLVSGLDYQAFTDDDIPLVFEHDYFVFSGDEFSKLIEIDIQFIFGVFLAIPNNIQIQIDKENLPYADLNTNVWKKGNIQHPHAEIELVCFDGTSTIIKFKDQNLSDKFHSYFDEAMELE